MVCERWCDKVVRERWCVTKSKMVCERGGVSKMVCERWCVTKACVKDGVGQRWCVKDGVPKMVCERWCVNDGG